MCGIWALFGFPGNIKSHLPHAFEIAHRGPDVFRVESIQNYNNSCLAFYGLSLVGGITGQQPMSVHEFPHLRLAYNGEIYNYKQLIQKYDLKCSSEMDGEVIIHLHHKLGFEKTLQLLDGVFAIFLFDSNTGKFHIGRDAIGVRPLFTLHLANGLLGVCSEAKGLIGLVPTDTNDKIHPFKPGMFSTFIIDHVTGKAQFVNEAKFTSVDAAPVFETAVNLTDNAKENIRNLLTDAVRKRLMTNRRIGCMLSGGLDSSLIACLVVKMAQEEGIKYPIQTFSIGFPSSPDLVKARQVAERLGTEHHEVILTKKKAFDALDDILYSLEIYDTVNIRSAIPGYLLCQYIRKMTDSVVILSGEGSDEITQGYIYFHNAPSPADGHKESIRLLEDMYMYDIARADRTVSAHGLELRVPFLDKAFCAFYLSLPYEVRTPINGVEKYLLRSAFDGYLDGLLTDDILWRPKEEFGDGILSTDYSWSSMLDEYARTKFNGSDLQKGKELFVKNTPHTFEALYYRQAFESRFPGHDHFTPYILMPKWCGDVNDPSGRVLKHYK